MFTTEKLTAELDEYMSTTLFLLYDGVNFVTKSNAIMKILDFQNKNNDTCLSPIHH